MKRTYTLGTAAMLPVIFLGLIAWFRPRDAAPENLRILHGGIGNDRATDLAVLAEESNLVFRGRVTRVDYRLSRRSEEGGELPHAIVTYDISEVVRGQAPAKTFTMRFIGGPDGRGRFLDVDGVPQFQPGDEDLLFVSSNGAANCPLVMCEYGRYRVLRGGVYNHAGFPVRAVVQTHAIARGTAPPELLTLRYPAPRFDDLIRNAEVRGLMRERGMSVAEMRRRYESEAPKYLELVRVIPPGRDNDTVASSAITGGSARATVQRPLPEGPMAIEEFVSIVRRIVARVARRPTLVSSIDPNAPIVVSPAIARSPGRVERPSVSTVTPTGEEAAEMRALMSQNFNPVIKR